MLGLRFADTDYRKLKCYIAQNGPLVHRKRATSTRKKDRPDTKKDRFFTSKDRLLSSIVKRSVEIFLTNGFLVKKILPGLDNTAVCEKIIGGGSCGAVYSARPLITAFPVCLLFL